MLAVCGVCVVRGQENPFSIRAMPVLAALDTDHDGVISAAEIAAAPESLRALDRDEDGRITAEECVEGGERGPSTNDMVKTLMAFDKNGNGQIERSELPERMQGLFDRGDLNKDGVLTMDEIRKLARAEQASRPKEAEGDPALRKRTEKMIMRVIPVLAALDSDHDGEISEAEIRNAPAALKTLDKNGDGRLTDDEVAPDFVRVFVAQGMLQFDTDGDGRISKEEVAAPKAAPFRATLIAADHDHDGYVTEEELIAEVRLRADLNHDGVVTQQELQSALQSGALGKEEVPKQ
jgi:Ca2+-binding EF-hand superfamily protein